jgi:hypothetical protein
MCSGIYNRPSIFLLIVTLLSIPGILRAQVANTPRLTGVFPLGAKAGTDCELTITGDGLEGDQQLHFSNPAITATALISTPDRFYPTPRPVANHFKVRVGASVPPGSYLVRVVSPMGISNSRTFVVGQLPELAKKDSGHDPATAASIGVNSVSNGVFTPQASDFYRFSATRGQRLVLHCAARSVDSRAEPQFAIYDSAGALLRRVHDAVRVDPTCSFTAPADGEYLLAMHDLVFAGGPEYGSTTADVTINGDPLERLEVTIKPPADRSPAVDTFIQPGEGAIDTFAYRLTGPTGASNPVRLALTDSPLTAEVEPNDTPEQAQAVSPPVQVIGRFNPRNDRDWYAFHARKGEKLWIEVISQRLGLPTDPRLTVQQVVPAKSGAASVKEIADVDDAPRIDDGGGGQGRFRAVNDDPALAFTAPEDGDYRVLVQDIYSSAQSAPWFFYLLSIRPAHPDFRLLAYPSRLSNNEQNGPAATVARKGCGTVIDVVALRRDGFAGAIELSAEGLPPGVTVRPGCIAPGSSIGAFVLQVPPDAPDWTGTVRIVGKASPPDAGDDAAADHATLADAYKPHVAMPAETLFVNNNGGNIVPIRLATDYRMAIRGGLTLPFSIEAGDDGKIWRIPRGGTLQIPVKLAQNAQFITRARDDDRDNGQIRLQAANQGQVRADGLEFDTGTSQKDLQVNIDSSAAPGRYSLMLRAEAPATLSPVNVSQQAAEDLKRIDAIDKQAAQSVQKAAQERDRAEQAVNQANGAVTQAQQQQDAAKSAADSARAKAKDAAQHVAQLEQADTAAASAASAPPTPAQTDAAARSKAGLAEARRGADEAAAQAKTANTALESAARALADAQQKSKLAEESRKAAIAADANARQEMKEAEEAQRIAAEQARKAAEISKPRDLRVQIASPPIRIEVLPAPFTLKIDAPAGPIQAGGKPLELPVSIAPDFGFADEIKFDLVAPSGAGNVALVEKRNALAKNQTQATLALQADKSAAAGSFTYTLRAHYQFNKRDLTLDRPIAIQVAPAAAK